MIALSAHKSPLSALRADLVVQFMFEDRRVLRRQVAGLTRLVSESAVPLQRGFFQGKERQTLQIYPSSLPAKALLLIGLGPVNKLTLEQLRRGAGIAAKAAKELKVTSLAILEPDPEIIESASSALGKNPWEGIGQALGEGAVLALYAFDRYRTEQTSGRGKPSSLTIVTQDSGRLRQLKRGADAASIIAGATILARDLANAPGNEIYPETLAQRARVEGRKCGFSVKVLKQQQIRRLKMGGLLGVSQGSSRPPRFIVMEYGSRKRTGTIVLVGKGVTFDAGGISIKPSAGMAEMKMDMSGAAAVLGALSAVARLRLPLHVVGLIPATENLLGEKAMKPGDILRHLNGKTSEVDNTDAEGRLILADALAYASRYRPALVVDLATLTGACVVALGHYASGMMGNDETLMNRLRESGERTYERLWPLPMFEEYERLIKSDVADVKNVGGRWGGAITAGLFLKKFIGSYKWIHLDIAGPAIMEEPLDYVPKGGSGVGVRLLVDFLRSRAAHGK